MYATEKELREPTSHVYFPGEGAVGFQNMATEDDDQYIAWLCLYHAHGNRLFDCIHAEKVTCPEYSVNNALGKYVSTNAWLFLIRVKINELTIEKTRKSKSDISVWYKKKGTK